MLGYIGDTFLWSYVHVLLLIGYVYVLLLIGYVYVLLLIGYVLDELLTLDFNHCSVATVGCPPLDEALVKPDFIAYTCKRAEGVWRPEHPKPVLMHIIKNMLWVGLG